MGVVECCEEPDLKTKDSEKHVFNPGLIAKKNISSTAISFVDEAESEIEETKVEMPQDLAVLSYGALYGRAEPIRMLLWHAKIKFEDRIINPRQQVKRKIKSLPSF